MLNLRKAFTDQRHHAKTRDIRWSLRFYQWLNIWVDSGHLQDRGLKHGQYVMSRLNDTGPYAVDNVEIVTSKANIAQRQVKAKCDAMRPQWTQKAKDTRALRGDDWTPTKDYKHLRERTTHPKRRAVVCPDGVVYQSAALAGDAHGKTRAAISHRCRTQWGGWRYQ